MARVSVTVCDKCGDANRQANAWSIMGPTETWKVDLCEEHATALVKAMLAVLPDDIEPTARAARTSSRNRGSFASLVTTPEEIEARKAKAKKRGSK